MVPVVLFYLNPFPFTKMFPLTRWKLKKNEQEARTTNGEINKSNEAGQAIHEEELYDDASSVMASTDEVTISIPVSYNYSQVCSFFLRVLPYRKLIFVENVY